MAVFRYSAALLDWGQLELEELDRQTRQFLYKHNFLHPRSNIDRFYMSRSSGGRGFESVEDCVANERRNLDFFLANSEEELLNLSLKRINSTRTGLKESKLTKHVCKVKDWNGGKKYHCMGSS